ncbi:MAG: hypothetical protein KME29_07680 [Calothrix sp. FI2-JRJ7]|nr:hypothetical protein [Calothrix sp. FI2-JRJ7]
MAVATGGAALIGAAGLVSIALVSKLDTEDKLNLGIAGVAGTLTSATVALVAWTAMSTTVSATGAAAISATIAALGGISTITGGAALIAFGAGYVVWQFLQGNKKRSGNIVKQLEIRLYTITEESKLPLVETLKNQFACKNYSNKVFIAPDIPLDKLANFLSQFGFDKQEKVLALFNTTVLGQTKNVLVFTTKRMIWKELLQDVGSLAYQDLHNPNNSRKLPNFFDKDEDKDFGELLSKLAEMHNA